MREILNRYTLGGLTAVYRREGDIVELLLLSLIHISEPTRH